MSSKLFEYLRLRLCVRSRAGLITKIQFTFFSLPPNGNTLPGAMSTHIFWLLCQFSVIVGNVAQCFRQAWQEQWMSHNESTLLPHHGRPVSKL